MDGDTIAGTVHIFDAVGPELDCSLVHVVGSPGPVLVAAATHTQLLIMGTRQRAGVARLLSGAVSQYCLRGATCPVAIPALPTSRPSRRAQLDVNALS